MNTSFTAEANVITEKLSENVTAQRAASPRLSFGAKYYSGSYSASYHDALRQAAYRLGAPVKDSSARALVSLIDDGKGNRHRLGVELHARLPGIDPTQAQRIMEEARKICPFSKSLRADTIIRLMVD